jgi:26S proteasome regulatory subunit N2
LIIDAEWPEIAESLPVIISLSRTNPSAALLTSKVYYHLGDLDKAVTFAIESGGTFTPSSTDEFTSTVVAHAIKTYIHSLNTPETPIVGPLEAIVRSVLTELINSEKYAQVLCLAIETRFQSFVTAALHSQPSLIPKAITLTLATVSDTVYRQRLLTLFVDLAGNHSDKFRLAQLYTALQRPLQIAELFTALRSSRDPDGPLLAFQIAFELAENASQKFRSDIIQQLDSTSFDLHQILIRSSLLNFYLEFLFRNNKTDVHIVVALKENLDSSKMVVHASVVTTYSFMYAGTGDDNFYRNNLPWFSNSRKWAQFMTIAGIGAIHIGHLKAALHVLSPFLVDSAPSYAKGGGLYGLGLIYANYLWDGEVLEMVIKAIKTTSPFVIKHGGCLALGLIALGSHQKEFYNLANQILHEDGPEAGEAAGYAIGMIMLGCGWRDEMEELVNFCGANEHEKVKRGVAIALALMMYGREDESETLTQVLQFSRMPIMRESAAWVTALAYVGTASSVALQRLLHLAVSDVNPDVRRAAVTGVGFILSRSPREVPTMVDLHAKSYHPHVRAGAAMALGIACAGTGLGEAIAILEPLLEDFEDFVKQAAMISMGMVLQQQSDAAVPHAKKFRCYLRTLIKKKRSDLEVFGLCVAYGILNAGGRNVVISCNSLKGENSALSTVGLALFCNYFYWHPLVMMLPLAFHPTAVIGLDRLLHVPKWEMRCKGSPKLFAGPPPFESEAEKEGPPTKAILSITAKTKNEMGSERPREEEEVAEEEEEWTMLGNPSRVTLNQLKKIDQNYAMTYVPITGAISHGIVMLKEVQGSE